MLDYLKRLFGGRSSQAEPEPEPASVAKAMKKADDKPRVLKPLDAPVIQARISHMGIYEYLDARYHSDLKRIVMEHCRAGNEEIWWWPLTEFLDGLRFSHTELPIQVIAAPCHVIENLTDRIVPLEAFTRGKGFQIKAIASAEGEPLAGDAVARDGTYQVQYAFKQKPGVFPVNITDGALDIPGLAASLNAIFRDRGLGDRVLLLPPQEATYGLVHCPATSAERAADHRWGRLDYGD